MGNKLIELMESRQIDIKDLQGKILVVDAYNQLYMFLATIRGPDGTLLTDSHGATTSHLVGLFHRFGRLMLSGLRFAFVFDGVAPDEKRQEQFRRAKLKQEATRKYEEAKERGDEDDMKKYAARTSRLTKEMIIEAKRLIRAMGLPVIEAPGEGEAQAAHIVKRGDAYAVMSQDADCLIFEAPRLIKNLTIIGKRKQPGQYATRDVPPELIILDENLQRLHLIQDQLICMALLTGTDYNYGGIKGIGPKKALALATKNHHPAGIFTEANWDDHFDTDWHKLYDLIKHPDVTNEYQITFGKPQPDEIRHILIHDHDFAEDRIEKLIAELAAVQPKNAQLSTWFS